MWISMLQAQNPKLVCQPFTTTHSFREAIEKSNSVGSLKSSSLGSIDSFNCRVMSVENTYIDESTEGLTFKVESYHFHSSPMHRSISEVSPIQYNKSELTV